MYNFRKKSAAKKPQRNEGDEGYDPYDFEKEDEAASADEGMLLLGTIAIWTVQ